MAKALRECAKEVNLPEAYLKPQADGHLHVPHSYVLAVRDIALADANQQVASRTVNLRTIAQPSNKVCVTQVKPRAAATELQDPSTHPLFQRPAKS